MLAGVAAGSLSDYRDAVERTVEVGRVHQPDPNRTTEYGELYGLYREIREGLDGTWSLRGDVRTGLQQIPS